MDKGVKETLLTHTIHTYIPDLYLRYLHTDRYPSSSASNHSLSMIPCDVHLDVNLGHKNTVHVVPFPVMVTCVYPLSNDLPDPGPDFLARPPPNELDFLRDGVPASTG